MGTLVLTVNPVAGANSPCDGYVGREGIDQALGDIIAGAGNTARTAGATEQISLVSSNTTDQYQTLGRMIFNFNTSSLGLDATIVSAVLSLYGTSKALQLGGTFAAHIVAATPGATNTIVNGDYGQLGSTSFGNIAYASLSSSGYNDFTLNANGILNISKTGVSSFGVRSSTDINNSFDGVWGSGLTNNFVVEQADNAGNLPKLVITYTVPDRNSYGFFM